MVKWSQKSSRTGVSQNPRRSAKKLKEMEKCSEQRSWGLTGQWDLILLIHWALGQSYRVLDGNLPLDFEIEGKKSMDREKYGFTTCTNASLSPPHTEWEKREHNRTLRAYFSLMSKSKKSAFLALFLEKIYLLVTSVVTVLTRTLSWHCFPVLRLKDEQHFSPVGPLEAWTGR